MRHFDSHHRQAAIAHAKAGHQAVFTYHHLDRSRRFPKRYHDALARGESLGRLFDQNVDRLRTTARDLGVDVVIVEDRFSPFQHVDLVGEPLKNALARCEGPIGPLFPET